MEFKVTVTIQIERESGKFVSKDAIADEIAEAVEAADYGEWAVDESVYVTEDWEVSVET